MNGTPVESRQVSREDEWSSVATPRVSWRWLLAIAVTTVLVVVGALAVVQMLVTQRRGDGVAVVPADDLEVERIEVDDRSGFLAQSPAALLDEAAAVLGGFAAAGTAEQALAFVRDGEGIAEQLRRHWQAWPSRPMIERRDFLRSEFVSDLDPAFMVVAGMCEDFTPFRAYFVSQGGRLRLDWEATCAHCEVPLGDLRASPPAGAVTVRCLLQPRNFHTTAFPEDRFRCYVLEDLRARTFVWGYVERGGELELELESALNADAAFFEAKSSVRLTLAIATPTRRDTDAQFLITEMLHIEWVMP